MLKSIRKIVKLILRTAEKLGKLLIYVACAFIALLVLLVFSSSVLRYAIGVPLAFADEVATLLFLTASILTVLEEWLAECEKIGPQAVEHYNKVTSIINIPK